MTIRELIKELLKDELKLDDEIRFYYKIQDDELYLLLILHSMILYLS